MIEQKVEGLGRVWKAIGAEEVREEGVDQGQEEEGLEARRDEEDPEALQDREGSEVRAEVRKDEGEGREVGVQATEEDHQVQDIAPIDAATGPGPEVEKILYLIIRLLMFGFLNFNDK
ncbi:unnamed protein product [Bursaphelenchus xylophilus]|nr:unnamed protein product [Bursaphelenchus xylophilus]CAG9126176.1 unnamed protein product [Bursaphelenchus xylophilus]